MAIYEDVAVILFCISDPHEGTIAGDGAVVKERGTSTQDRIATAVDTAVQPVTATVGLKRITVADDMDILEEVALAID